MLSRGRRSGENSIVVPAVRRGRQISDRRAAWIAGVGVDDSEGIELKIRRSPNMAWLIPTALLAAAAASPARSDESAAAPSRDELIAALESGDDMARARAAMALRFRREDALAAVPQLAAVLVNDSILYREYAGWPWPGSPKASGNPYAELAMVTDSDAPYRIATALDVHYDWFFSYTYGIRQRLEVAFANPEAGDPVMFVSTSAAEEAGWTLARIANDEVLDRIIALLQEPADHGFVDRTYMQRRGAARTLEKIGDARAVSPLIAMMFADREPLTRMYAVQALATIGDWHAIEPLIRALKTRVLPHRKYIARGLNELTGRNFGKKQKDWYAWWENNRSCYEHAANPCEVAP